MNVALYVVRPDILDSRLRGNDGLRINEEQGAPKDVLDNPQSERFRQLLSGNRK